MPYIGRKEDGSVYGIWATEQWEKQEWLPDDSAEIATNDVPRVIEMRQARKALSRSGLLVRVEAVIKAMTGQEGAEALIDWEFSPYIKRYCPLTLYVIERLGITESQADDIFRLASTL